MPSCEQVHDWIEGKGFESIQEALAFIRDDYPRESDNPNLYECVRLYDFEYEYKLYGRTSKRGKHYDQLSRRSKVTGRFVALGLDSASVGKIKDFLRSS